MEGVCVKNTSGQQQTRESCGCEHPGKGWGVWQDSGMVGRREGEDNVSGNGR